MPHNYNQSNRDEVTQDSELNLAVGSEVVLVSFTNNTGQKVVVSKLLGTGNRAGAYRVLFRSEDYARGFRQGADLDFDKEVNILVSQGETVEIRVENCGRSAGDFYGFIHYHKPY